MSGILSVMDQILSVRVHLLSIRRCLLSIRDFQLELLPSNADSKAKLHQLFIA